MAEIRTTGLQGGDLVTTHQPPETVREWAKRHMDAYKPLLPDTGTLSTTWPDGCGVTTYKQAGESAVSFHARHANDVAVGMQDDPPDPA
jgi:hypothetical protein